MPSRSHWSEYRTIVGGPLEAAHSAHGSNGSTPRTIGVFEGRAFSRMLANIVRRCGEILAFWINLCDYQIEIAGEPRTLRLNEAK